MPPRAHHYLERLIVNGQSPRIWAALGDCATAAMLCWAPVRLHTDRVLLWDTPARANPSCVPCRAGEIAEEPADA
eukprot:9177636-Lingulodinium_polyedra.AAC.1